MKTRTAETKLKRPEIRKEPKDFYHDALQIRLSELNNNLAFEPTIISEFAAGYGAAISAIRAFGFERVSANAQSGIAK